MPTIFWALLQTGRLDEATSVRKLAYAGASMTPTLAERLAETLNPERFVNHFGSTEIYTFSIGPDSAAKPGCAGRAGVFSRLRLVDPDPGARPDQLVAPGEQGQVAVSMDSPEAFAGYWNRPDADAKSIRDGWYFTGDLATTDEDGDLWVSGRVDDMINSGGENIYPEEIENALAGCPDVDEVIVVGTPHDKWGHAVTAFVVGPAGVDPASTLGEGGGLRPRRLRPAVDEAAQAHRRGRPDPEVRRRQDPAPTAGRRRLLVARGDRRGAAAMSTPEPDRTQPDRGRRPADRAGPLPRRHGPAARHAGRHGGAQPARARPDHAVSTSTPRASHPGVAAVIGPDEVLATLRPFPLSVKAPTPYYPTATDKTRFVGEPVAVVVATDRYAAEDAAELVEIDYEPLPAVVRTDQALRGRRAAAARRGRQQRRHRPHLHVRRGRRGLRPGAPAP